MKTFADCLKDMSKEEAAQAALALRDKAARELGEFVAQAAEGDPDYHLLSDARYAQHLAEECLRMIWRAQ